MLKYAVCALFTGAVFAIPPALAEAPSSKTEPVKWTVGYDPTFEGTKAVKVKAAPDDALCPEWWPLARKVGWPEDQLETLDYVIHRESRCNPESWNKEDPFTGSRGLAQVNGSWKRWLKDKGIITRNADLFDPETNLRASLAMWQYGMDRYGWGWGPWRVPQP